jgi:hypothetical protein
MKATKVETRIEAMKIINAQTDAFVMGIANRRLKREAKSAEKKVVPAPRRRMQIIRLSAKTIKGGFCMGEFMLGALNPSFGGPECG